MKQEAKLVIGLVAIATAAAGGGYWFGHRGASPGSGANGNPTIAASVTDGVKHEHKILYYRNPMGLADTSPVPKKDPMGMSYVPVLEGGDDSVPVANQINISTDKVQKLGVRTEAASLKAITKIVRSAGRIEADERHIYTIAPKFEGYVEQLHVNVSGQPVFKGQPLFEVYSPELVSAQREYIIAEQGVQSLKTSEAAPDAQASMKQLAASSLMRLLNWDISNEQLKALVKSGEAKRSMTFRSPVSGIVTEKKAVQGMRFMPGETLYQISDLTTVWALADVFEQDIGSVKTGAKAKVTISAYPDKIFEGAIAYVYPTINAETRTMQVRVELRNPGLLLKPGMFAQLELAVTPRSNAVTIPLSSVIDSGTRRIVLVQVKEGKFDPREVKLGARSDDYVEVLDGVKDGELVVVAANFLIDAESNLKAAIGTFGHAAHGGGAATKKSEPVPVKAGQSDLVHKAEGTIMAIDAKGGTVSIKHSAIVSLNWPAMTMEFKVADNTLLDGLKPGANIAFELVERQPGEWVVTGITHDTTLANPHAGH